MSEANEAGFISARFAPTDTSTSPLPITSNTLSAFLVFFSTDWFPATVVTANISSELFLAPASIKAIASSCPGSQSIIIFLLIYYTPSVVYIFRFHFKFVYQVYTFLFLDFNFRLFINFLLYYSNSFLLLTLIHAIHLFLIFNLSFKLSYIFFSLFA